jgi:hypothetical protein
VNLQQPGHQRTGQGPAQHLQRLPVGENRELVNKEHRDIVDTARARDKTKVVRLLATHRKKAIKGWRWPPGSSKPGPDGHHGMTEGSRSAIAAS